MPESENVIDAASYERMHATWRLLATLTRPAELKTLVLRTLEEVRVLTNADRVALWDVKGKGPDSAFVAGKPSDELSQSEPPLLVIRAARTGAVEEEPGP